MDVTSRLPLTIILAAILAAAATRAAFAQDEPNARDRRTSTNTVEQVPARAGNQPEAAGRAEPMSAEQGAAPQAEGASRPHRTVLPNAKAVVAPPEAAVTPREAADDAVAEWLQGAAGGEPSSPAIPRKADAASAGAKPAPSASMFSSKSLARLLWPLAIVLGVIAALAALFRRWAPRSARFGGGGVIEVLARHHLSPKQSLCLVRVGRRLVLVGVSPERISAVTEIGDPEEAAAVLSGIERGRPGSFSSVFAKLSDRDWRKPPEEAAARGEGLLPSGRMAEAGATVRDLIGRVRHLGETVDKGGETRSSAEPT